MNSTYRERVAISRDVARVNFARFVGGVLSRARQRNLTDAKIKELTGVGPSTFHRWRRAEWGKEWPELQKVIDFCEGLGEQPEEAFGALGVTDRRQSPSPEAPLDPDVKKILRRLADPNVSDEEKTNIRAMMRYLANLADQAEAGAAAPDQRPSRRPASS